MMDGDTCGVRLNSGSMIPVNSKLLFMDYLQGKPIIIGHLAPIMEGVSGHHILQSFRAEDKVVHDSGRLVIHTDLGTWKHSNGDTRLGDFPRSVLYRSIRKYS